MPIFFKKFMLLMLLWAIKGKIMFLRKRKLMFCTHWRTGALILMLGVGSSASWATVSSSSPSSSQLRILAVSDPQLQQLRGRYSFVSGSVAFFGIQMTSQWYGKDGGEVAAQTYIGLSNQGHMPMLTIQPTITFAGNPQNLSGQSKVINSAKSYDAQGIRQQIQVAGNDNWAENVLSVEEGTQSEAGISSSSELAVDSGENWSAQAGRLDAGSAGIIIHVGGTTLQQRIGGQNVAQQLIQLEGDQQQAGNSMQLFVQMASPASYQRFQSLRSIGRALSTGH
jgi:hypothetical protein